MLDGSIEPIDLDIAAIINENFSPSARSAMLADVARDALAAAEKQNEAALGFVPTHTTTVDGAVGQDESRVKPDGVIEYVFDLLPDVFAWIMEQLSAHSPVGLASDPHPGLYQSSHALFADGARIDPAGAIPIASKYVFFNTQAYSRQIEGGESSQAPKGVYEAIATLAQQQFGNQANISFAFISPPEGAIVDWAGTAGAAAHAQRKRGGNRGLHLDWLTRVPAIIVTLR